MGVSLKEKIRERERENEEGAQVSALCFQQLIQICVNPG